MKRKETTGKPSPVQAKKGRTSISGMASPPPLSEEEQRKRAREWAEREAKKMKEMKEGASSASKSRSTTPTSKTPKKAQPEEPAEPAVPRSSRKSISTPAAVEAPPRAKRAKVEKPAPVESSESESEEEVAPVITAPVVRARKTPVKSKAEAPAVAKTPKAEPAAASRTPKSSIKVETPRLKTPVMSSASKSNNSTPRMAPFPSEPARSPVAQPTTPRRQVATEESTTCCESEACEACGVTMVLTAVPLAVIGYYDWKIAATTLTVVVVMAALRRIFRMVIVGDSCCSGASSE